MKRATGLLGLLITLGVGLYFYLAQIPRTSSGTFAPKQQIDLTGVKRDLLAIAQAERLYMASNGSYVSIEQLQQDGSLTFTGTERRGYHYEAEIDGSAHFKITATPTDPLKKDWPTLLIDETMEVTER
jgi:hypothetical protein